MNLTYATARQIAAGIRGAKISCCEAITAQIERIETLDPKLNAVVVRDFQRALQTARAHDRKRKRLDALPPLFGVPMTIKESYDIAGLPTCCGVKEALFIAGTDALPVTRLKEAGAIIMGKTNVPVMLMDWQSTNPVYGTTNNPWDVTRWLRANEARYCIGAAWQDFFSDWDVFITPVSSIGAQKHDLVHRLMGRKIMVDGVERQFVEEIFWSGIATLPLPAATAAPLGFTNTGLPFGMQILGAPLEDRTTIAVAAMLEKSWLGFQKPPGF